MITIAVPLSVRVCVCTCVCLFSSLRVHALTHAFAPCADYTYYKQHGEYETEITSTGLRGNREKGRKCTDPISLCIFLAFLACWIGVVAFSISKGDPWRALNGVDSFGNVCGRASFDNNERDGNYFLDMVDYPYLYCKTSCCALGCNLTILAAHLRVRVSAVCVCAHVRVHAHRRCVRESVCVYVCVCGGG